MSDVTLKVRPIDQNAAGFLPRYRQLLSAKRALADFAKAQPEDIDEALKLLVDHVTEPVDRRAAQVELEKLSVNQLMEIFSAIMGENAVPPANGGA